MKVFNGLKDQHDKQKELYTSIDRLYFDEKHTRTSYRIIDSLRQLIKNKNIKLISFNLRINDINIIK